MSEVSQVRNIISARRYAKNAENLCLEISATYVHGKLGTAKIAASNIESSTDLPLGLGLLDFTGSGEVDSPAIIVEGLALAFEGHLVVGEGVGGGAVSVVDLQLARGLLDFAGGTIVSDLLLGLPLQVEVLQGITRA